MTQATPGLTAALLLADARFPAGGHAHSGGAEPACATGVLTDLPTLELFLRGRLRTSGVTAAGLAAAACETAASHTTAISYITAAARETAAARDKAPQNAPADWALLDAEADARMPSPAQRNASRQQGRTLLRAVRTAWETPAGEPPAWEALGRAPHHPIVLGAAAAAAGCTPRQAAHIAAYHSVSGPASAAVRLLGLDPIAVSALVARLAPEIDATATASATGGEGLPFPTAPNLDLLAEIHATAEVRLFES